MKRILIPMLLGLSVLTLGAQTVEPAENAGSVPVKHWEFDYYNYSISGGQETLYMNFTMALRYNFDTPLVDVGGEFTVGATPHDRHDPTELNKGDILKRTYIMLSPVAHYNFRRGKNASFYAGLGIGSGLGTREVFEGCTVDADGNIFEELKTEKLLLPICQSHFWRGKERLIIISCCGDTGKR